MMLSQGWFVNDQDAALKLFLKKERKEKKKKQNPQLPAPPGPQTTTQVSHRQTVLEK